MEINVLWQTSETYSLDHFTKLKDFTNNSVVSLKSLQLSSDYELKFCNNNINKIFANNYIKDLISKFHGNRIDLYPTDSTKLEIENNLLKIEQNQSKLISLKEMQFIHETKLISQINWQKIHIKLKSLIKPINETNSYYLKVKEKIIKKFSMYDDLFKESEEIKINMMKIKTSETLAMFNKILEYCCKEFFSFIYKYGQLFLNHKQILKIFYEIFKRIYKNFIKEINIDIEKTLSKKKSYKENEKEYKQLFQHIEDNLISYRVFRYLNNEPPSTVFFSFDEEVNVNFSEMQFNEIKSLLSQFPNFGSLKHIMPHLSEEQLLDEFTLLGFERDIRIYKTYGIQMEDFIYGYLLYEN